MADAEGCGEGDSKPTKLRRIHPPTRLRMDFERTKVRVANIHRDATPELLRSFFEFHGNILRTQYAALKPPGPRAPPRSSSKRART